MAARTQRRTQDETIALNAWAMWGPRHYVTKLGRGWTAEIPGVANWPCVFRTKREAEEMVTRRILDISHSTTG